MNPLDAPPVLHPLTSIRVAFNKKVDRIGKKCWILWHVMYSGYVDEVAGYLKYVREMRGQDKLS